MYILSIDVGIKNLAHCLLKVEDKQYKIIEWDSIDICNITKKICEEPLKKNKKDMNNIKLCGKTATLTKNNKCYCKVHSNKTNFFPPGDDLYKHKINRYSLDKLREIKNKYEIECDYDNKDNIIKNISKFIDNNVLEEIKYDNAKDIPLVDLGVNMKDNYDNLFNKYDIDIVIIENQISTIATRMKTIQGMIMQYFIMKHTNKIEFISSTNKLKLFTQKKTSYKDRKKLGIQYCLLTINNNSYICEWLEIFNKHKKKDDLADSFLQGLWYMNDRDIINNI